MTRRPRGPPSAGPPKPPQLDQKMSDSSARTAPTATSRRLTPIPMFASPFGSETRDLRVCRGNAEVLFLVTALRPGAIDQADQGGALHPVHHVDRSSPLIDAEDGLVGDAEPAGEGSTDGAGMAHRRNRPVRVLPDDLVERPGNPFLQLLVRLAAGKADRHRPVQELR